MHITVKKKPKVDGEWYRLQPNYKATFPNPNTEPFGYEGGGNTSEEAIVCLKRLLVRNEVMTQEEVNGLQIILPDQHSPI